MLPQFQLGQVVDGRFAVEREAGSGGMGQVYLARDAESGKNVALKLLIRTGRADIERFEREAEMLAALSHPGIVRYVAHGRTASGDAYLAMEWLDGSSLSQRLREDSLSVGQSVSLLRRISSALRVAHEQDVVHRDIKPSNIYLVEHKIENAKVMDFGLARSTITSHQITATGAMVGTPAYMAPEQARGASLLDVRVDVFALGCLFFECLAGEAAFQGPNLVSVLAKILVADPPSLDQMRPGIPRSLTELVNRMLAKDPDARPSSAGEVQEALEEALDDEGENLADSGTRGGLGRDEQRLMSVVLVAPAGVARRSLDQAATVSAHASRGRRRAIEEAVGRHGGEIEWLIDGSIVITLVGVGSATDRAAQAARCALAIREILPDARIALATGRGIVDSRVPVGDAIDAASQLIMSTAPGGAGAGLDGVLIDTVTTGLLDTSFAVGGEDAILELRGQGSGEPVARTLLGNDTPCVGRTRELRTLLACYDDCVEEEVPLAILLVGPAGIGKSRMRSELLARLEEHASPPQLLFVRASPSGAGSAFGMIAKAIRAESGIRDDEPLEIRRAKLRARVGRHVPRQDAPRVTDFLGEMVGVSFDEGESVQLRASRNDAALRGEQIRRAFIDWLSAECQAQPTLLFFEDLHHGDLSTIGLVDQALARIEEGSLMVVAFARPEVHDVFPHLWADRGLTEVSVGPLSRKAASQLARAVLPDLAPARLGFLLERSGGNPFFLEELLRAEAEGRGGETPETLLAMVQARLESFEPEVRRMLRAASVLGQHFWSGALGELLGDDLSSDDIAGWLNVLIEREVITHETTGRLQGQVEFSFRNGLWRDASYTSLTEADRVLGHRLAGAWLERVGENDAQQLARHFEIGELLDRAARWYAKAASVALAGNDSEGAKRLVGKGIGCGATGELLGALRLTEAESHKWLGENEAAERAASEALSLLPRAGAAWLSALGEVAATRGKLGQGGDVSALADGLLGVEVRPAVSAALVTSLARTATQMVFGGRLEVADRLLARLDEMGAEVISDAAVSGWVLEARAIRAGSGDDPGARLLLAHQAAASFEGAGDLRNACLQNASVGFANNELGDYAAAVDSLQRALSLGSRLGLLNATSTARAQVARAMVRQGRHAEGEASARQAIGELRAQGNTRLEGVARSYLAWSLMDRVELAAAEEEARRAVDVLATAPPLRAAADGVLAQILLRSGRMAEALSAIEDSAALVERLGRIPSSEGLVRLAHAQALHALSREEEALAVITRANDRLERRAAEIRDHHLRDRFLLGVEEHSRTLVLARDWLEGGAS